MTPPGVSRILIIEDEAVLRSSMARSLAKVSNVEVVTAANLAEGLSLIDSKTPQLILSDIDLPDRSGLELIGELGQRHLRVPIVYISAYLTAYRAQIPPHANVEVLEKPVGIEELREVVRRHTVVTSSPSGITPFGIPDYLQLADLGRHSVVIEARGRGRIVVKDGELWSAKDEAGDGRDAFCRLALLGGLEVTCQTLADDPGPRTLEGKPGELLLEAARRSDESGRSASPEARAAEGIERIDPQIAADVETSFAGFTELTPDDGPIPPPAPSPSDPLVAAARQRPTPLPGFERFDALWDEGVEALLAHRYSDALASFTRCNQLRPDDRRVLANLQRLQTLLAKKDGQ